MNIVKKILSRDEFRERPPVLLDIGAAGQINPKWREIAPYSVCVAFDADDRKMGYAVKESSGYRKLYVYNCIVAADGGGEQSFYLTRSPECSSLLRPRTELLKHWGFARFFDVDRSVRLKTISLPAALEELRIRKIDWFKTDSQGIDLRLFKSLGENVTRRVLAAEFEPGIMDTYQGEDKLWSVLSYMEEQPFWMSDASIRGTQRFNHSVLDGFLTPLQERAFRLTGKISPGWAEVTYLNSFAPDADYLDKRDYLLGWIFAMIEKQYGFALELAVSGHRKFCDPVFNELKRTALCRLRCQIALYPFKKIQYMFRRLIV